MFGFLIERHVPNASQMTSEQLRQLAQQSRDAIERLGKPYKWHYSYVAGDMLYCVHEAECEDDVRAHAQHGTLPADRITMITARIDPTSNDVVRRN